MKKTIFLSGLIIAILGYSEFAEAKIWRVNGNGGVDADFTTIQDAIDGARNGDTIIVEPMLTGANYGPASLDSTFYIFGSGYFLDENDSNQANLRTAKLSSIVCQPSSAGSKVSGLEIGITSSINAANITIERCLFSSNSQNLSISDGGDNATIRHCFFPSGYGINMYSTHSVAIHNNYFGDFYSFSIDMDITSNAMIYNNIFNANTSLGELFNSSFYNNIVTDTFGFSGNNNTFHNNVAKGSQFGTANGNIQSGPSLVFADWNGSLGMSTDAKWMLKAGSPALGAANDGGDCGMYGGTNPYRLSGMPPIPSIYEFVNDPSGNNNSNTLNVRIKAKGNN